MPVGTHATVKSLDPAEVRASGADIVLCNAYHLALRPGVDLIERAGGLHAFMGWDGPILTDSGGYQLVSLRTVTAVDEQAATFVSPYDGSRLRVTPEEAVAIQARMGADIVMCLDQPVAWGSEAAQAELATQRTHRWAGAAGRCTRAAGSCSSGSAREVSTHRPVLPQQRTSPGWISTVSRSAVSRWANRWR